MLRGSLVFLVLGFLALDFYRAADRTKAPCVVVVPGGGWDSGDRGQLATFNHWLARRGYAVAAISYRLAELGVPHALIVLPWTTHALDYNLTGPGGQLTRYALERFLAAVTR